MKEALVLEVALDTVRMLRLGVVNGEISLMAMEQLKLPVYENDKTSDDDIINGIKALHEKTGSKSKFVNCVVPGKRTFIRYETLPPVTGMKLHKIIEYELESQILIKKEQAAYDYQIINDDSAANLLLVGCRSDVVERQISLIEKAGMKVSSVEFSPGALYNAYLHNYEPDGQVSFLLNICPDDTDFVIQNGVKFLNARSLPGGFSLFIDAIKKKLGVPREEAERIVEEEAAVTEDVSHADKASKIVISELNKILQEAHRYINFLKNNGDFESISKIYLSGYGSLLPGADTYVSQYLEVETELLNPLKKINIESGAEDARFYPSSLATLIGAGLKELINTKININLLPDEKKTEINSKKKRGYFLLSTILMITLLFTPFIHVCLSRFYYSSRLANAENVLSKYEKYIPGITKLSEERKVIAGKLAVLGNFRKQNVYYPENLSRISQLFPEDIYLNNFLVRLTPGNKVEHFVLGGTCRDYNEIEEIVDTLNSSSLFRKAKVNEITDTKDESSPDKLSFAIYLTPSDNEEKLQ